MNISTYHKKVSNGASETDTDMPDTEATDTEKENEVKIKITDGNHEVTFRLNNGSAAKSLYEQLPLTVEVENYGHNEKIFFLRKNSIPPMSLRETVRLERWPISPPGGIL